MANARDLPSYGCIQDALHTCVCFSVTVLKASGQLNVVAVTSWLSEMDSPVLSKAVTEFVHALRTWVLLPLFGGKYPPYFPFPDLRSYGPDVVRR